MLLTRHYDQRPFDETVCDALITNDDVKNRQKRCKTFAMNDTSNTIQILVACAMKGIQLICTNCFAMRQNNRNGQPDQGVCDIRHMVHSDKLFLIRQETETIQLNKMCVICGKKDRRLIREQVHIG